MPDVSAQTATPGGIFEYTVESASCTEPPSLARRAAKLEAALMHDAAGGGARGSGGRRQRLDLGMPPMGESHLGRWKCVAGREKSGAEIPISDKLSIAAAGSPAITKNRQA
jgi:hypothetical protein